MHAIITRLCNIMLLLCNTVLFIFVFDNSKDTTQSNGQIVWKLYKASKHVLEKVPDDVVNASDLSNLDTFGTE